MSTDKAFFKAGRGLFGKDQKAISEEDILLFKRTRTTAELINNGEDGKNKYITALDLLDQTGTGIISGGKISLISGYKYEVPPYVYGIRGEVYEASKTEVTLEPASTVAGENRQDIIVGTFDSDGNGLIEVIKGDYALNPILPTVKYETQIFLTSVPVDALTTTPATVVNDAIYNENTEFVTSATIAVGTADFNSLTAPFNGVKCIAVEDFQSGDILKFVGPVFTPSDSVILQLQIQPTSGPWDQNGTLKIGFYLGNTLVSNWVIISSVGKGLYSFVSKFVTWQNLAIDIADFAFIQDTADTLVITKDDGKGPDSFKLDLIRLQKGVTATPSIIKTKLSEFINDVPFLTAENLPSYTGITSVTGTAVDNTDPLNPVINIPDANGQDLESVLTAGNFATDKYINMVASGTGIESFWYGDSFSVVNPTTFGNGTVTSYMISVKTSSATEEYIQMSAGFLGYRKGGSWQTRLRFQQPTLGYDADITFPNRTATAVLSVNNTLADSNGNVTLTVTGGEPALGNPPVSGYVLSSTTGGVRSWIAPAVGGSGVSSVGMSVPVGLTVSGSPITTSGTLVVTFTAGYSIPTTANQANWTTAYSWGNHSGLYSVLAHTHTFASLTSKPTTLSGYGITDAMTTTHVTNAITNTNITNWNTAYGWGNHAGLYSLLAHTHTFASLTSLPTTLAGYGITDASLNTHVHTFASLTSKPTTITGYAITDAVSNSTDTYAGTPNATHIITLSQAEYTAIGTKNANTIYIII